MFSVNNIIPSGGVVKHTDGTYVQVFNAEGLLVHSHFVASDACVYTDDNGNILDDEDTRINFYASFDTNKEATQ